MTVRRETKQAPQIRPKQVDTRQREARILNQIRELRRRLRNADAVLWIAVIDTVQVHSEGSQKEYIFPISSRFAITFGKFRLRLSNTRTLGRMVSVSRTDVKKGDVPRIYIQPHGIQKLRPFFIGVFETEVQAKVWHQIILEESKPRPRRTK